MLVLDIVASNGSLGVGLYHSVGFWLRWRLSAVLFSRPAKDCSRPEACSNTDGRPGAPRFVRRKYGLLQTV